MALDFPNSPTPGDQYTLSGKTWQWDGTTWNGVSGSGGGATITDDTSTNVTEYVGLSRITSGSWTTAYTASTQLTFNPSTGTLSSTFFNTTSDERAKENIRPLGYGLQDVLKLLGQKFEMKGSGITSIGLIAQQVQTVIPEVVGIQDVNTGMLGVNYPVLVAVLVEAIKELTARLDILERSTPYGVKL